MLLVPVSVSLHLVGAAQLIQKIASAQTVASFLSGNRTATLWVCSRTGPPELKGRERIGVATSRKQPVLHMPGYVHFTADCCRCRSSVGHPLPKPATDKLCLEENQRRGLICLAGL